MTHPDDDLILRYALETLDAKEHGSVGTHVDGCPQCSVALADITRDLQLISEYGTGPAEVTRPAPPRIPVPPLVFRTWFRAAAAIAVVILGGYLATGPGDEGITVVPQQFRPAAVVIPPGEFAPCEVVDIAQW
jgi:anti-sigma factor RsiW